VADGRETVGENDEPRGRVDLVSLLYILGGIPSIVGYIVFFFILARFFNFPA
jgi:hypothetical protein